ncbi:MAG: SLC13 family permease [Acidimicrobiia bacterium]
MTVVVGFLLAAVALLTVGHRKVRPLVAVGAPTVVALIFGVVTTDEARASIDPLIEPVLFLVFAVPLAIQLDRVGFFDAAAGRVAAGHRLRPSLWVFAAAVTTVFNLDAAIVLLTPLYVRIAYRHGLDPLLTAFQPVLLAALASSALPVSNLTNLIVAAETGASFGEFLLYLGLPSLVATVVGWMMFRRSQLSATIPVVLEAERGDPRPLRIGGSVVVWLLVGFTAGDVLGIPAWMVVASALVLLSVGTRTLPVRGIPIDAIGVVLGLGVLAGAAPAHLGLGILLGGEGAIAEARALAVGIVGSDIVNNLPMLIAGLPHVEGGTAWALLLGTNLGPVLWLSGSLAGLLWLDIVRRLGLQVTPLQYARVGWRVGLPAIAAATPVLLVISRLAG